MSTAAAQTYKRGNPAQGLHLQVDHPSFANFPKQCCRHGARVTAPQEVYAAFATALAVKGPSLVEIVTEPELV